MFGSFGTSELIFIGLLAFLLLGPEDLVKFARMAGKVIAQIRRQSDGMKREFMNSVYPPADEFRGELNSLGSALNKIEERLKSKQLAAEILAVGSDPTPTAAPSLPAEEFAPTCPESENQGCTEHQSAAKDELSGGNK